MKIVHVNLAGAGIGRYGALLGRALAAEPGHEVISVHAAAVARDVPQLFGERSIVLKLGSLSDRMRAVRRLRGIIRELEPDVVHDSAGRGSFVGPFLWRWASRRTALVVTEHDPVPHTGMRTRWRDFKTREARRHPDRLIVHGPWCRQLMTGQGVGAERISIVPHGPLGFFGEMSGTHVERERRTALYFGALRPNKGFELLPEIARRVRERVPDFRLIVAGSSAPGGGLSESGWAERAQRILSELRAHEWVEVREGFIPDADVGPLFARARVTLLPYLEASQSGVAMIALALGSTVVSSNVGDLPDVVRDGETGLLAAPSVEPFADAVVRALEDSALADRLAANGVEMMRHNSWDRIARTTIDVYRDTAEGQR